MQLDDWLLICGCVLIVSGIALWSIPAALIAAGVLMIGIGLLIGKQNAITAKSVQEQPRPEDR
jgi:hypothetical protein